MDAVSALAALGKATADFGAQRGSLDALDAEIGDGDHGTSVANGFAPAYARTAAELGLAPATGPGGVFLMFGRQLLNYAGGASGPLYATLFTTLGRALGDTPAADVSALAGAFSKAAAEVARRGGAHPGDATILDALLPYATSLAAAAGAETCLGTALHEAYLAASAGADDTAGMVPARGRARGWGPKAVGHVDPGARSFAVLAGALDGAMSAA
jgi:phosphoenolpyruvate---glycerone phosphotransferase subunit DhaL